MAAGYVVPLLQFQQADSIIYLAFALGFLIQGLLITRKKFFSWKNLLAIFLIGGYCLWKANTGEEIAGVAATFALWWGLVFSLMFRDDMLENLTEQKQLQTTIIFVYAAVALFQNPLLVSLTMTAFVFVFTIAFTKIRPPQSAKLILYVWAIIMNLVLLYFIFGKEILGAAPVDPLTAFTVGMICLTALSEAVYVFWLFPLKGKHEPFREAIKRSREMAEAMVRKYVDVDLPFAAAAAIVLLQGGILLANYFLGFMPAITLVALSLIVANNLGAAVVRTPMENPQGETAS